MKTKETNSNERMTLKILTCAQGEKIQAINNKHNVKGIISDLIYDQNNEFIGYMLFIPSGKVQEHPVEIFIDKNLYFIQKLLNL